MMLLVMIFFNPPLLTLCCPYRLNSELPHCLVLGSSQRLRGREPCVLMATRHLDCFEKQPSRLITVSRLAVLSGEGYWEVTPSLRGPLLCSSLSRSFFRDLKGASLFFNRRRFQPGGEINYFVSAHSTSRLIYPPLYPSFSY